jgi:hypothetical protein
MQSCKIQASFTIKSWKKSTKKKSKNFKRNLAVIQKLDNNTNVMKAKPTTYKNQFIKTDWDVTEYYSDKAMTILHREDGPAVVTFRGYKEWYINGKLHREDGPAAEFPSGTKAWYLNGERVSEADMPKLSHSSQA